MNKKIAIVLLTVFLSGSPTLSFAQGAAQTVNITIKGMTCAMCAAKVENTLKKLDGVQKVVVDHKTGKGSVELAAGKSSPDQVLEACNKTGFKCEIGQ